MNIQRFFGLIVLIAISATVHAQSLYTPSRLALYSGLAFDLGTSEYGSRVGATEGNPILGDNRAKRIPLAIGLTIATDLLTRSMKRDHPRIATVCNFIVGSVHVGAGVWNLKVARPPEPKLPAVISFKF